MQALNLKLFRKRIIAMGTFVRKAASIKTLRLERNFRDMLHGKVKKSLLLQ